MQVYTKTISTVAMSTVNFLWPNVCSQYLQCTIQVTGKIGGDINLFGNFVPHHQIQSPPIFEQPADLTHANEQQKQCRYTSTCQGTMNLHARCQSFLTFKKDIQRANEVVQHILEGTNTCLVPPLDMDHWNFAIVQSFKDCRVPYIFEDVMALNATSTLYTSISFSLDCSQHSTAQAEYSNTR